ncbi:nucleotidyltransferase family protein [Sulfurimonas sp.]|uniref:nucleotidyltransferase family protein n=1 Tax=Sulfurimonas sp. TaxID=2022749 RepID=UPI003561FC2F
MKIQEAIVLAGGLGTRLQPVIHDVPKPLAPINGIPFLTYLLDSLNQQNITHVVLAVGYMHEKIQQLYNNKYKNIDITYSIEDKALQTGGAIKKALKYTKDKHICICNGDTFFQCDINTLFTKHISLNADISVASKRMKSFNRYGQLITDNDKVIKLEEKKQCADGLINAGVYIINRDLLNMQTQNSFSFEYFLQNNVNNISFIHNTFDRYFIDIGIPEDYKKAEIDFKELF